MQRFSVVLKSVSAASKFAAAGRFNQTRALATKMSKSHEFAKLVGDIATVGITAHAAGALGDIVYVDLPSIGAKYKAGDTFGSVESVKAASDVYAPISGEVMEVNSALEETPGKVNESPIEGGWFMKLKVDAAGKAEFAKLLVRPPPLSHYPHSLHFFHYVPSSRHTPSKPATG